MKNDPLVSICSITYNHAPFIRQCLDGFLMQQTTFPIEIIINDDCSTDGTTEIIREYAEKHPDKIFPVFHEKNLYSQGVRGMFQKFVIPKVRGKYVAICEGDDYWTDAHKLQKQVDFLEAHPDYSMCFHRARVLSQDGRTSCFDFSGLEEREYSANEIVSGWLIPTASIVYRSSVVVPTHKDFTNGDVILHAACVSAGRVYCMTDEMSVYRLHAGGWSAPGKYHDNYYLKLIPHYIAMMETFPRKTTKYLKQSLAESCWQWVKNYKQVKCLLPARKALKGIMYSNIFFLRRVLVGVYYRVRKFLRID